jgi:hypothetical protein
MFSSIHPTPDEVAAERAGDDLLSPRDVVMDRAFTVAATPDAVWPWLAQLGKRRAGWYLPARVERFIPRSRRGLRVIDPVWPNLELGDVVADYGGAQATLQVAILDRPTALVYQSRRGRMQMSWSITLTPQPDRPAHTRVHLRLAFGPVRRKWLANSVGDLFDALTTAGLAAGLDERLSA